MYTVKNNLVEAVPPPGVPGAALPAPLPPAVLQQGAGPGGGPHPRPRQWAWPSRQPGPEEYRHGDSQLFTL